MVNDLSLIFIVYYFPFKSPQTFSTLFLVLHCIKIIIILPMQTMTSTFFAHLESAKEGPPWPDWLIWAEHRNVVSELWMPFSMTECFCKWSYSGCCPEAFSVFRLQSLLVAIEKGNTKLKIRVSLCISFAKTHSEKYPFRIWMHQNRWNLDNFPPCVHISITRLFHIHKSEGSYIMQTAIRRNAVSSLRTHCV